MVKVVLVIFCFLVSQLAANEVDDVDPNVNLTEEEFLEYFHVDPADDPEEEKRRTEALAEHEEYIKQINQQYVDGKINWFDKVNEFSNLPDDEAEAEKTGLLEEDEDRFAEYGRGLLDDDDIEPDERSEKYFDRYRLSRNTVPDSYSSVDLGYVSPVKNQGSCGSCAAFATTAMIETCFKKATGVFGDYSEQHLVDCAYHDDVGAFGCNGAYSNAYAKWAKSADGLLNEQDYPYQGKNTDYTCPKDIEHFNQGARVNDYYYTWSSDEELLKQMVYEHGAVYTSVGVYSPFFSYGGGVFAGCEPDQKTNHAVVVVGYGTTKGGEDYWTIKNSWGTGWGESGFMRIKRGESMCGIGGKLVVVMCESDTPTTTTTTTTNTTTTCEDQHKSCKSWAYSGECVNNPEYMLEYCPAACQQCVGKCENNHKKCKKWARKGRCTKNQKYMDIFCRKACKKC